MSWKDFNAGRSIGSIGSENGIIIRDIEHIDGARITLEKQGAIAPFAVTFGIYGLMFHTHYMGNEKDAINYFQAATNKIEGVLSHLKSNDETDKWQGTFDRIMEDLVEA